MCRAQAKDTPDAPAAATRELEKLGPLSLNEKITAGAFAVTVGLWIFGAKIGVGSVAAATVGLAIMLVTNVITWKVRVGPGERHACSACAPAQSVHQLLRPARSDVAYCCCG